ncbi:MAG: hypothetical protein HUU56_09695 [Bdellovibrionaceae bacterium]|nr:hypothetical protein [Pseudobdellovibrionaceae bacterium]
MNLQKWVLYTSTLSLAVLIILYAYSKQTQVCLKSQALDKIIFKQQEVSSCFRAQKTDWSFEINKKINKLNARLSVIEKLLKINKKLALKVEVVEAGRIHEQVNYDVGNHLFVSEKTLEETPAVEMFIIRNWIKELNPKVAANRLLEDLLVNFKYFQLYGEVVDMKKSYQLEPKIRWAFNQIQSHQACVTHWKLTQHWDLCLNRSSLFFDSTFDFVYEQVHQKVLKAWIQAFNALSISQKYEINNNFKSQVQNFDLSSKPTAREVVSFSYNLKLLNRFWLMNEEIPNSLVHQKMLVGILKNMNSYKYSSLIEKPSFDLIYFKENLNLADVYENEKLNSIFRKALNKNPNLKIAVSNFKEMVLLPLEKNIRMDTFNTIKANQVILDSCKSIMIRDVVNFQTVTSKLVLTYNCDSKNIKSIDQLLEKGAQGFASQNIDVQFVQFHLPSLISKTALLNLDSEVFQYVQARNIKNSIYEVFGWKELNWDQVTKSYKPKAYVDAVGYFRTGEERSLSN